MCSGCDRTLSVVGLIHANHGGEMIDYLLSQLRDATSDVVRHGGCLGVGLAAMGTARQDVYDQLKHCLELDDAVTGLCSCYLYTNSLTGRRCRWSLILLFIHELFNLCCCFCLFQKLFVGS